ncbi:hypothetical protein BDB01DRAFT_840397 [Pilobolus umbonatus]|nr:hypothetical protein BDB01DRAFT_840397 [Pilobolus umbonatus]
MTLYLNTFYRNKRQFHEVKWGYQSCLYAGIHSCSLISFVAVLGYHFHSEGTLCIAGVCTTNQEKQYCINRNKEVKSRLSLVQQLMCIDSIDYNNPCLLPLSSPKDNVYNVSYASSCTIHSIISSSIQYS